MGRRDFLDAPGMSGPNNAFQATLKNPGLRACLANTGLWKDAPVVLDEIRLISPT